MGRSSSVSPTAPNTQPPIMYAIPPPMVIPKVKIDMARGSSLAGKRSLSSECAGGDNAASPTPTPIRATNKPPKPRTNAARASHDRPRQHADSDDSTPALSVGETSNRQTEDRIEERKRQPMQQPVLEVGDFERLANRPHEDRHDVAIDEGQDVGQQQNSQRPAGTGPTVGQMSGVGCHDSGRNVAPRRAEVPRPPQGWARHHR